MLVVEVAEEANHQAEQTLAPSVLGCSDLREEELEGTLVLVPLERREHLGELAGGLELGDDLLGRRGACELVEELDDGRRRQRADELPDDLPLRKALTAGMPRIPYSIASSWFESTSTLTSARFPARASASRSSTGPSIRQGPHQAAQKSTTTGSSCERSSTSCSKVS